MRQRVLVATRSAGKLRELRTLLAELGYEMMTLEDAGIAPDPREDGIECHDTFRENARAKARFFYPLAGGLPVLAEDSGLEVLALGGRPGVHSKRWSGRADLSGEALDAANNRKLVESLRGRADRRARYVCEAVWKEASGERVARGETAGRIVDAPRGSGGFGYDPYFQSDELGVTFGEATAEAKHRVSHRGRAVRALLTSDL